jgi:hypothetical protein
MQCYTSICMAVLTEQLLQDLDDQAKNAITVKSQSQVDLVNNSLVPTNDRCFGIFDTILSNRSIPESEKAYDRIAQEGFVALVADGKTTGRALLLQRTKLCGPRGHSAQASGGAVSSDADPSTKAFLVEV